MNLEKHNMDKETTNTIAFWLRIIGEILILIAKGMSQEEAISNAAIKYGVSENTLREKFKAYKKTN